MVSTLRMINFRCFESLSVEFPQKGCIISGANALGKTSILEAVCLLVRLHSPRSRLMSPMIRVGEQGFGVAGSCWEDERRLDYTSSKGLEMKVNEQTVSKQNDYLRLGGLIVWMGNEDMQLIRGRSSSRRRYLDFLGSQLDLNYREHLLRYNQALRARNILLKGNPVRESELNSYTELLLKHGEFLTNFRVKIIKLLEEPISRAQKVISNSNEQVFLKYKAGMGGCFSESLHESRERERRIGQTLVGPHRDDFELFINQLEAVKYTSEGQQRTLALALKIAQGRVLEESKKIFPVYLLDDIFGELDPDRRNALLEVLPREAQKIITTTHTTWMEKTLEVLEMEKILKS